MVPPPDEAVVQLREDLVLQLYLGLLLQAVEHVGQVLLAEVLQAQTDGLTFAVLKGN